MDSLSNHERWVLMKKFILSLCVLSALFVVPLTTEQSIEPKPTKPSYYPDPGW